jgi:hypothetical protein
MKMKPILLALAVASFSLPAYDAKRFGIKMTPEVTMITTERAYTSPIWFTPSK